MTNFTVKFIHAQSYDPLSLTRMWDFRCIHAYKSETHVKGTKDDDIQETGEPAERLLDPIFKVGANNKPQCSFKLEVKFAILIGQ